MDISSPLNFCPNFWEYSYFKNIIMNITTIIHTLLAIKVQTNMEACEGGSIIAQPTIVKLALPQQNFQTFIIN